jgi:hypothetical protein
MKIDHPAGAMPMPLVRIRFKTRGCPQETSHTGLTIKKPVSKTGKGFMVLFATPGTKPEDYPIR